MGDSVRLGDATAGDDQIRSEFLVRALFTGRPGAVSDRDGRRDRVAVGIIGPRETEHGLKVPVITDESPY